MSLKFSQSQFDQLNDIADDLYECRLVKALSNVFKTASDRPDERELREICQRSRLRAAALGISAHGDTAVFVLFAAASSSFDKEELSLFQGWVTQYLQRESSPGEVKVALAEQMLRSQASLHPLAARMCEMAASIRTAVAA